MSDGATPVMDEDSRRYYLEMMGIQCWQSIDAPGAGAQHDVDMQRVDAAVVDSDVVVDYADLEKRVQKCTECQLHKTRKQAITGRGKLTAGLMFVVLAPDGGDDESGVICSGESNALLSKMLAAININIEEVYITSILKCSVPKNHTLSAKEIQSCSNHLKQQIQFLQPEFLVVLGETAVRCLLQKNLSIDDFREMNNDMSLRLASLPLFVSYSPEELLLQPENKRKAWSDLKQLQKIMDALK